MNTYTYTYMYMNLYTYTYSYTYMEVRAGGTVPAAVVMVPLEGRAVPATGGETVPVTCSAVCLWFIQHTGNNRVHRSVAITEFIVHW
jgi:hypothetical protein